MNHWRFHGKIHYISAFVSSHIRMNTPYRNSIHSSQLLFTVTHGKYIVNSFDEFMWMKILHPMLVQHVCNKFSKKAFHNGLFEPICLKVCMHVREQSIFPLLGHTICIAIIFRVKISHPICIAFSPTLPKYLWWLRHSQSWYVHVFLLIRLFGYFIQCNWQHE